MKKWLLYSLLALAIGTLAFTGVRAYAYYNNPDNQDDYSYYMGGGMRGACWDEDDNQDYDFLYLHLSDEDQATIDVMYAEKLAEYDFSTMTAEEQLTAIETVKSELATYIVDNFSVSYWYDSTG